MDYLLIPLMASVASLLTFFSGFGLGTILMPVVALFFPLEVAIALTAIVHLLNNLFKVALVGKYASKAVVLRFGLPAILMAIVGAWLLAQASQWPPLYIYSIGESLFSVHPMKLLLAILIAFFTLFEMIPSLRDMKIDPRYLSIGGAISGFFGGLSGHQGALRSAFLARADLTKEQFIASGTIIACLIDVARLATYSKGLAWSELLQNSALLVITTIAAFLGAYLGTRLLKKITMRKIQLLVSVMLILLALALGAGLI